MLFAVKFWSDVFYIRAQLENSFCLREFGCAASYVIPVRVDARIFWYKKYVQNFFSLALPAARIRTLQLTPVILRPLLHVLARALH